MSTSRIVPVPNVSDADPTHRPKPGWTAVEPPTAWLEKLGTKWMTDRGQARPGLRYYLDRLPAGYVLFNRPRPSNPSQADNHLYGHPKRIFFDSANRFYPHFNHLITSGNNQGCPCTVCNAHGGIPAPMGGSRAARDLPNPRVVPTYTTAPQAQPQPTIPLLAPATSRVATRAPQVDEEQIRDVTWDLINKLRRETELDTAITEPTSMDWRAERAVLPELFEKIARSPNWMPRVGEVILFCRRRPAEIIQYDRIFEMYKLFNVPEQRFCDKRPVWEAAVVAQVPEEPFHQQDLVKNLEDDGTKSVVFCGFRVEPYPDPNGKTKVYTKQYTYVYLDQIRPFALHQEILRGVDPDQWHPTINNARTIMSTVSLVDRYHFKGVWPAAYIKCRGVYIGAEFITVGDIVRLMPDSQSGDGAGITDILLVTSIRLSFANLDKASDDDHDDGHPYNTTIHIYGKAFTSNAVRILSPWNGKGVRQNDLNVKVRSIMESYGGNDKWTARHDSSKAIRVTFTSVLGKVYDATSMRFWLFSKSDDKPEEPVADPNILLNCGLQGLRDARAFSSNRDKRIKPGKSWFWGDSRAETLDVHTINNVDVSYYDEERDFELFDKWQNVIKVLNRTASAEERMAVKNNVSSQAESRDDDASLAHKKKLRAFGGISATISTDSEIEEDDIVRSSMAMADLMSSDTERMDKSPRSTQAFFASSADR